MIRIYIKKLVNEAIDEIIQDKMIKLTEDVIHVRDYVRDIERYIKTDKMIDDVVERIQKKQLPK